MKAFSGFASGKVHIVGMPEPVFTELIPLIDDLDELKVTLHILWRLGRQRGTVRYIRRSDLASDRVLLSGLSDEDEDALSVALERAVERGSLLRVTTQVEGVEEELLFANTPKGRAAVETISEGEWPEGVESANGPTIYTLYEQNIGLLTPLITEELREAEQTYPADWIEDAFREAVSLNKRSWRYIRAILERWRVEGKGDEEHRGDRAGDRRRYISGEYGDYIEH